ncbi:2Fe-2S iron-sulfur cluster-binding protein [Sphingomonas radiodurans]|uniref:2Fe-2S iron-sulfur cluster-binding protein n=1 Tax=Sphingomonas radiodurans TaxID=2890321 RepID=UPI001E3B21F9|nr:2Fe-2S iron-sulfur cluster-binding protein [Sphingomonas radiodurans]WBH17785.1 2Fe-2S iron-sulfur cluster-binding protein [Sphingomonas radiodurans]
MIDIEFVQPDGTRERVFSREGYTLMEAGVRAGVPGILAECGGACACATCHVIVDPAWVDRVGPPNSMEEQLLDLVDLRDPASRLACQVKLKQALDGLVVHVAPR